MSDINITTSNYMTYSQLVNRMTGSGDDVVTIGAATDGTKGLDGLRDLTSKKWVSLGSRDSAFKAANLETRKAFMTAFLQEMRDLGYDVSGGKSAFGKNIPPAVMKALKLKDFSLGDDGVPRSDRPLTARRIQDIAQAVETLRRSKTVTLTMPGSDKRLNVPANMFNGFFIQNGDAGRGLDGVRSVEEVQRVLNERLKNGFDHLKSILDTGLSGLETVKSKLDASGYRKAVADITLLLQVRAQEVGKGFERGSMSIEDRNGTLLQFFKDCPDAYGRASTHLKQIRSGVPDASQHYGIDIDRDNLYSGIPNGMGTILFGKIPTPAGSDVGGMFWIKTETYSTKGLDGISHLGRLGKTDKFGSKRGEDVPKAMTESFKGIKAFLKTIQPYNNSLLDVPLGKLRAVFANGLQVNGASKGYAEEKSVRSMYARLTQAKNIVENEIIDRNINSLGAEDRFMAAMLELKERIATALKGYEDRTPTELKYAIGDEVVLTYDQAVGKA